MPESALQAERRSGEQNRILTNRMVTIVTGRRGEVVTADTVNLGPGGMFVATDTPFGVGDRFICRIDLGEPYKPVLSGAEVRWVNDQAGQQGMGVQFLDIGEAANSLSGDLVPHGLDSVRLRMQAVGPALEARVVQRAPEKLVIDVALPFLARGTQVDVGPDIAARTAAVEEVEWLGGEDPPQVRLSLDLEPPASHLVAEHVAQSNSQVTKVAPEKSKAARAMQDTMVPGWQRPAPPVRVQTARKAAHQPTSRPEPVQQAGPAEDPPEAPVPSPPWHQRALRGVRLVMAALLAKFRWLVAKVNAGWLRIARRPGCAALIGRLVALGQRSGVAKLGSLAGRSRPAMRAVWLRAGSLAQRPGLPRWRNLCRRGWAAARRGLSQSRGLATLARRGGAGLQRVARQASRLRWSRRRRQTRGSPSPAVARMMERAKLAATGRARTVLWGVVLLLGLAGLAALGYGLMGTAEAEVRQDRPVIPALTPVGGETWHAPTWQEPDPVRAAPGQPSQPE